MNDTDEDKTDSEGWGWCDAARTSDEDDEIGEAAQTLQQALPSGDVHNSPEISALLTCQAEALDKAFNRILEQVVSEEEPCVEDERLKVALQAQRQCCQTIDTLRKNKNSHSD